MVSALTLRIRHHRPLMLLLVAAAVVAVVISWAKVAQTIAGAKPAVEPGRPTSIVWANRVFDSSAQLRRWLRSRGSSYVSWERRYPSAAAILERRPAPAAEVTTTSKPPVTHAVAAAVTSSSGSGYLRDVILALLAAACAACAAAAVTPTPVLARYPGIAQAVVPHRELLLAGAAALSIGLLVGAVLT
jgi:hypothetical protein